MPLLRNNALLTNPYLRDQPDGPEGWSQFIRTLNQQSVLATAVSGSIESVAALPTLASISYPIGSVVYYTVDGKLYRNVANSWTKAVDGADVTANTLLANAITSGTISAADIQIGSNGIFRSGQTAYDTGTGWYLDYNAGTPRFSIGNSAGNKLTWNGSTLAITGALSFTNSVQSWTPTWAGFTVAPSGDLKYLDFGAFVLIWADSTLTGTSSSTGMQITNLPSAIGVNSTGRIVACAQIVDNATSFTGFVGVEDTVADQLNFYLAAVSGTKVGYSSSTFTAAGATKGLAAGFIILYAK